MNMFKKLSFIWANHKWHLLWYYTTIVVAEVALTSAPIVTGVLVEAVTTHNHTGIYLFIALTAGILFSGLLKRYVAVRTTVKLRKTIHGTAVEKAWLADQELGVVSARYHQAGNIRVFVMLDVADILRLLSTVVVVLIGLSVINTWFGLLVVCILSVSLMINIRKANYLARYVTKQHDLEEKKLSVMESRSNTKLYRYIKQQTNIIIANANVDQLGYLVSMPMTTIGILAAILLGDITNPATIVVVVGLFYKLDFVMDQFSVVQQSVTGFIETLRRF